MNRESRGITPFLRALNRVALGTFAIRLIDTLSTQATHKMLMTCENMQAASFQRFLRNSTAHKLRSRFTHMEVPKWQIIMSASFLERQKDLCLLSSFIEEQEEWLKSWVSALGWTLQSLQESVSVWFTKEPHYNYYAANCYQC
jgi:hypothetical protein